ncbi:MAG: glycogen/starch synthase, partial [Candidatus Sumerlaeia bacterium]|nr:glycogen/starch synthase [Candidatus Sumerlaeia bacterium]
MKSPPLKILFVASEMTPLAKSGGLADVVGALAHELQARGHDVRVVLPFYSSIRSNLRGYGSVIASLPVQMGDEEMGCSVAVVHGPGGVPVHLIEHHHYFSREGFYHDEQMRDYPDNARRFGFLCRAALAYCDASGFEPDIVHAHD